MDLRNRTKGKSRSGVELHMTDDEDLGKRIAVDSGGHNNMAHFGGDNEVNLS